MEESSARKLGATGNVKAKYSKGTVNGKRAIINSAETEITHSQAKKKFGISTSKKDSIILPKYGQVGKLRRREFREKLAGKGFIPKSNRKLLLTRYDSELQRFNAGRGKPKNKRN